MSDDDDKLMKLVQRGRKVEAIQRLRERTGMGLAEAKAEVERLSMQATAVWAPSTHKPPSAAPPPPGAVDGDIRLIAEQGRRIEAIRLLRERHQLGLKEAKARLDAAVPPPPARYRHWVLLALALAIAAGLALYAT